MKRILLSLAIVMLAALPVSAQIPRLINYQGILTDDSGVVVPDGSYSMIFRLYDVPTEGSPLWMETVSVNVSKGIFSTTLGYSTPIEEIFSRPLYLSLEVNGAGELTPRRLFTASAYALGARGVYGVTNLFPEEGNVGIGVVNPEAPLHIYTNIADSNQPALLIQNTGNQSSIDFEMATVTEARIRKAGGGDLFLGTVTDDGISFSINDTPRHRMATDGSFGIDNISPLEKLDVNGAIRLGTTANSNAGTIRWTGADFEGYDGSTWQSLTSGGGSGLPAGSAGQTLRHDGADWVASGNLYNDGTNIGIGTIIPTLNLHIAENADGLVGIRIENNSTAAGSQEGIIFRDEDGDLAGIALLDDTSPSTYAGVMSIYNNRPSGNILFRTGSLDRMKITDSGKVDFYDGANRTATIYSNGNGGNIKIYDETGAYQTASLEADFNGTGGYLSVYRTSGIPGFYVDGSYSGTEQPLMTVAGSARSTIFDMSAAGDASVMLPTSSISASEILDEPGIASATEGAGFVTIGTALTTIISRSITVPASGYVLAIASAQGQVGHTNGTSNLIEFGVSNTNTSLPANQDVAWALPSSAGTGTYAMPITVHGLFEVTAGTSSYYFLANKASEEEGSVYCLDIQLTLLYIPTRYGTVEPTLAGGRDVPDADAPEKIVTASDISSERLASIEANNARMERELADMRARLETLQAELADPNKR